MKSNKGIWVVCLSCEHQYFLEQPISKMRCRCPICNSKEFVVADDYEDPEIIHEIEKLLGL